MRLVSIPYLILIKIHGRDSIAPLLCFQPKHHNLCQQVGSLTSHLCRLRTRLHLPVFVLFWELEQINMSQQFEQYYSNLIGPYCNRQNINWMEDVITIKSPCSSRTGGPLFPPEFALLEETLWSPNKKLSSVWTCSHNKFRVHKFFLFLNLHNNITAQ